MKLCKTCKQEKPLTVFGKNNYSKDGLNYVCDECRAKYELERRIKKGIIPKIKPIILEDSKECLMCKVVKHKDEFGDCKRGRLGKKTYCKICNSNYHKQLNEEKPDEMKRRAKEYTQRYRDNHREHWRSLHRINQFNRKNKVKLTSDGTVTEDFMKNLYSIENCYWCKNFISYELRTAEHISPLHLGGLHSVDNLTMACQSCNFSKLNFHDNR